MDWHEKGKNSPQKIQTKLKPLVSRQMKNGMMPLQRPAEFVKGISFLSIVGNARKTKNLRYVYPWRLRT